MVIVKNCHTKWSLIIPEKLKDDDWEIPAYDKDKLATHKFHKTLWSDGRTGQVKGGGWAPEAYDALSEYITKIKAFCKADKANGWGQCTRKLLIPGVRTFVRRLCVVRPSFATAVCQSSVHCSNSQQVAYSHNLNRTLVIGCNRPVGCSTVLLR